MKKNNSIYQLLLILLVLFVGLTGCEETVWPEVNSLNKSEYLGLWKSQNFRTKTSYIRTQDIVTKDYSSRDTSFVETVEMQFEFTEDLVTITSTIFENGVPKTPVVKSGYYSIGETKGSDETAKATYINIWEKATTMHSGFANPVAEPFTTYTVLRKTSGEMDLLWTLYNNTAQNSVMYSVALKK